MRKPQPERVAAFFLASGKMARQPGLAGFRMAKRFVKKYRTKRAFKWLKRRLVPASVRAARVHRKWRRKDLEDWPPPGTDPAAGLGQYEYSHLSQNGEGGLIRFLFSEIRVGSSGPVELGFGAVPDKRRRP